MRGHRLCGALLALVVAIFSTPSAIRADGGYAQRVTDLVAKYQDNLNSLKPGSDDQQALQQMISELQGDAQSIDQLQQQIQGEQSDADDLESQYNNAKSHADALRNQYEADNNALEGRIASLEQQAAGICSQLGGSWGDNVCNFQVSCSADEAAACQARLENLKSAFEQQAAPLNSQLQSLVSQLQSEKQQADSAQQDADTKQQTWEDKKSALAQDQNDLNSKTATFDQKYQGLETALAGAHAPITPKLGPAYQQAVNVLEDKGRTCYDTGCAMAIAPPVYAVPDVVANSPAHAATAQALQKAEADAESARQKLREVERDPNATSQDLQQRIKEDSIAQGAVIKLRLQQRLEIPDLVKPVAPKPANPTP